MAEKKSKAESVKPKAAIKKVKKTELVVEAAPAKEKATSKPRAGGSKVVAVEAKQPIETSESAQDISDSGLETTETIVSVAKAGKHSAKAIKEEQERQAKEQRKASAETVADEKPKVVQKPSRPKNERAGKKYREAFKLIDKTKGYSLDEALELAIKTSTTKFDSTVELHVNLGVDPKQADQNVRDTVVLPSGTGKVVRIAVLAEADDDVAAKAVGADIVGQDAIFENLDKELIEFDVLIATPAMMPKLGKYARVLGPRGLMPNPKSGTVTTDVAKAVADAKGGRVEYRVDQAGIVHMGIGKVSFGAAKLLTNADAVMASIRAAKPASLKGNYIKSIHITTSMGPSIRLSL